MELTERKYRLTLRGDPDIIDEVEESIRETISEYHTNGEPDALRIAKLSMITDVVVEVEEGEDPEATEEEDEDDFAPDDE